MDRTRADGHRTMKKAKVQLNNLGPLPSLDEAEGALIIREQGSGKVSVTPKGLDYIEYLAAEFCTIGFIASKLGVSKGMFEKLLGKTTDDPPTEVRAAWEAGRAALETETQRYHLLAMRKGNTITPMFISKTEWSKREAGPAIEINSGAKIQFTLPGSYQTEDEYMKSQGQAEVIDSRPPERRGLKGWEQHGLPAPAAPMKLVEQVKSSTTEGANDAK